MLASPKVELASQLVQSLYILEDSTCELFWSTTPGTLSRVRWSPIFLLNKNDPPFQEAKRRHSKIVWMRCVGTWCDPSLSSSYYKHRIWLWGEQRKADPRQCSVIWPHVPSQNNIRHQNHSERVTAVNPVHSDPELADGRIANVYSQSTCTLAHIDSKRHFEGSDDFHAVCESKFSKIIY